MLYKMFQVSIDRWFQTSVGVYQDYLLFPLYFDIFLEHIMNDVLEELQISQHWKLQHHEPTLVL